MALFSSRIPKLGTENAFLLGEHIRRVEASGRKVVRLNLGQPDFEVPKYISDELKRQVDLGNTGYCDPQGLLSLRKAVARYVSEPRGLEVSSDRVVVFPGGKPPIGFCQEAYCGPGDEVIYPSPGFPIYESFTRYVGAVPVPLRLREERGFSFDGDDLGRLITDRTKLIYLNSPSNPTGGVASRDQLEDIAAVIEERCSPEVRVYSDEIYEEIVFDEARHVSIASVGDMARRTIVASGLSKTFAWPGGRVGYAVFPTAEEAQVFTKLNINYFSCVSPFSQEAARAALEGPQRRREVGRMVAAFRERRDYLVDALGRVPGLRCAVPKGTFFVFPNIEGLCEELGAFDAFRRLPREDRGATSPSTLVQMFLLYRHGVATVDRLSFGRLGAADQHHLRLSFAGDLRELEAGVERMRRAARDRKGFADFVRQEEVLAP